MVKYNVAVGQVMQYMDAVYMYVAHNRLHRKFGYLL